MLRVIAVRLLTAPNYRVLEAENAAAAIRLVEQYRERIDLLLTDSIMPDMSGGELATELRKLQRHLKALFMAGYAPDLVARHGAIDPDAPVVEKPFTRRTLLHGSSLPIRK